MTQPEWLTAQFIERVLRNADKDNSVSVTNIVVKIATNKGDNYTSELYRVFFELTKIESDHKVSKQSTLIVKVPHTTEKIHKELVSIKLNLGIKNNLNFCLISISRWKMLKYVTKK